ncbi:MAG: iron-containing alcohol dehydrogenase [Armatimonadetes bacterium]|nr:iron-containing alcohol dehydrogenase [Armatimonadota bacterium]
MARIGHFESPLPTRIIFGSGRLAEAGKFVAPLGRKALVVVGSGSVVSSGALDRLRQALGASGVECSVFSGVPAEPPLSVVDAGREAARQARADVVIGMGGGSVIDVAKAIAALAFEEEPTARYHRGERPIIQRGLPCVAIPTTAGTGAEVTPNSVLTDTERGVKASLRGGDLMPAVALIDPELTVSCPPWQTAYSGLDAIVQALESYVSKGSNPYSDALALRAFEIMAPAIRTAVENGEDLAAREAMALGAAMAGMALACARLGLVHGLAHPIGHICGVPHGMVCAMLMPAVMEFNLPVAAPKYAAAAGAIGLSVGDDVSASRALIDWMRQLCTDFAITRSLDSYGLTTSHYGTIIEQTLASGSTRHNPRDVTAEDVRAILDRLRTGQ